MESQIELKIEDYEANPNSKIVRFVGDLDATNVEYVLEKVCSLINEGNIYIFADFEKLRYVNSTGLGVLLHFNKSAKEKGGSFKIANVNENVYEIIEIIGATSLLEIFEDLEEALQSAR
ncbi:MAG: anti-sigma factor antagonist [Chitinivibrionales bacterium]|nr:anti-sigma factor antagonist [Chitinivibrionales bacterium]